MSVTPAESTPAQVKNPAAVPVVSPPKIPSRAKNPALVMGAYTNRVFAAVQAGHHSTSSIVTATRIPRDVAIKTISYLIRSGRIFAAPLPPDALDGDRYVTAVDPVPDANPLPGANPVPHFVTGLSHEHPDSATADTESGSVDTEEKAGEWDKRNAPLVATGFSFPASGVESLEIMEGKETMSSSLNVQALRDIAEEWRAISAEAEDLKTQAVTLQTRLETLMETLPDFHAAQASIEQALQYREVISRIAQGPVHSG